MDKTQDTQLDDVYTIYPAHLKRLMEEHNLTVPEICSALGMPSLHEWYAIQKQPNQPVRHPRIVQTARIYLRHPERLSVSQPSIRQFIQRCISLVGNEANAIRMIEAILHKQWRAIEKWLRAPGADHNIDISIRRLVVLMMDMDDAEFLKTLSDGSVSYFVQVNACPVHTFENQETGQRLYSTAHQPEFKRDVLQLLDVAPAPGKRVKDSEFVVLHGQAPTLADVKEQMGENAPISAADQAIEDALGTDIGNLPSWHKMKETEDG